MGDIRVHRVEAYGSLPARDIFVHLPEGQARPTGPLPVLYMHDGQNLFDTGTSFAGAWDADAAAEAAGGRVVIVGIANASEQRAYEYMPWRGGADAYLDFLTRVVRPWVESTWPVRTDRAGIGIAGSSLGGLVSLYAAVERWEEYGSCGAFSPALIAAEQDAFQMAASKSVQGLRIYLDVGRRETVSLLGGDPALYASSVRRMRDALTAGGADVTYVEDDGEHNESAWRARFPEFLRWFLERVDH